MEFKGLFLPTLIASCLYSLIVTVILYGLLVKHENLAEDFYREVGGKSTKIKDDKESMAKEYVERLLLKIENKEQITDKKIKVPQKKDQEKDSEVDRRHNFYKTVSGEETEMRKSINEDYEKLRAEFEIKYPPNDTERLLKLAKDLRGNKYETFSEDMDYDIHDCPGKPLEEYPKAWSIVKEIIPHWNPDNPKPPSDFKIHQGLCIFDYHKDLDKALNYRNAEKPFILKNDPNILSIAERWNDPDYLPRLFKNVKLDTEHSENNHFMYFRNNKGPKGWKPPTTQVEMSYTEWLKLAESSSKLKLTDEHYYFRANGCKDLGAEQCTDAQKYAIAKEIPMFQNTHENLYIVNPKKFGGMNCRFGMTSVIAENHYDGSRNFVMLLKGERRYILAHPNQCPNMVLYPKHHPSGRHSMVDWSDEESIKKFPKFAQAMGNEIVLQAGDLLYIPTYWFHYIISLEGVNFQCNGRSGYTETYDDIIIECDENNQ